MPRNNIPNENPAALRSGDSLPPLTREMEMVRGSFDREARTAEFTLTTESRVPRWFGIEILDHSPGAIRDERITSGRSPWLYSHSMNDQRGVIESWKVENRTGRVKVRFSRNKPGEALMRDIEDGIAVNASAGYRVHRFEITENLNGPDEYRAVDWEPLEGSSVAIGADPNASLRDFEELFGQRNENLSTRVTVESHRRPEQTQPSRTMPNEVETPESEAAAEETRTAPETANNGGAESQPAPAAPVREERAPEPVTPESPAAVDPTAPEFQREVRRTVTALRDSEREIHAIREAFPDYLSVEQARDYVNAGTDINEVRAAVVQAQMELNPPEATRGASESARSGTRAYMHQRFEEQAIAGMRALGHPINPAAGRRRELPPDLEQRERRFFGAGTDPFQMRTLTGAVNLADIAALDEGIGAPIIEEAMGEAPEVGAFPVDTIAGANVELSVRTALPNVGFRNANEGRDYKRGTFSTKLYQTMVIEEPIGIDIQGVLNASANPARVLEAEALAVTSAVLEHLGEQTWYGGSSESVADSKAPPGLIQQYDSSNEVDVGDTVALSSVWMVRLGPGYLDHVYGNDTSLNIGDFRPGTLVDSNNKKLQGLEAFLSGRWAVRLQNKHAAVRLKNNGTTGASLNDADLFNAFKIFKQNKIGNPNAIFMTPREHETLRKSRTATNSEGNPAPLPATWNGIPIIVTNNLSLAES